jgi:hypothetical protein
MYIHFIGAVSTLTASLQVWMAWVVDDPLKGRVVWMVVICRAHVYPTFGFMAAKSSRNIC